MNIEFQVAQSIYEHPKFTDAFSKLQRQLLMYKLPEEASKEQTLPHLTSIELSKLIESALSFSILAEKEIALQSSGTPVGHYVDSAYRIVSSIFVLHPETFKEHENACDLVLSRLSNYPVKKMLFKEQSVSEGIEKDSLGFFSLIELSKREVFSKIHVGDKSYNVSHFQKNLWDRLHTSPYLSIHAPTSSGKSFILRAYLIDKYINSPSFSAVFVVPTKSLLSEAFNSIKDEFKGNSPNLDISLNIFKTTNYLENQNGKSIFILTPERLSAFLASNEDKPSIDTLIVDEMQIIGDPNRGAKLKATTDLFKEQFPNSQIILGSPMLRNSMDLAGILGIGQLASSESESPAVAQNIIKLSRVHKKPKKFSVEARLGGKDVIANVTIPFLEDSVKKNSIPATLANMAFNLTKEAEQTLIFSSGKEECSSIVLELCELIQKSKKDEPVKVRVNAEVEKVIRMIEDHIHEKFILAEGLSYGVGCHFGAMPSNLSQAIEGLFKAGHIKYIVSTSTLLHGVNLPAKNLFICKPRIIGKSDGIKQPEFWNLLGRAGRLGKDFEGNVFLIENKSGDEWVDERLKDKDSKKVEIKSPILSYLEKDPEFEALIQSIDPKNKIKKDHEEVMGTLTLLYKTYSSGFLDSYLKKNLGDKYSVQMSQKLNISLSGLKTQISTRSGLPELIKRYTLLSPVQLMLLYDEISNNFPSEKINPESIYSITHVIRKCCPKGILLPEDLPGKGSVWPNDIAYDWINGRSLKTIIEKNISEGLDTPSINKVIRKIFTLVNNKVSYELAMYVSCYIEMLMLINKEKGYLLYEEEEKPMRLDLFLELGVSNRGLINLITLGFSRMVAIQLEGLFPLIKEQESPEQLKKYLSGIKNSSYNLDGYIKDEFDLVMS